MDPSTSLLGNAAGADPNTTESADGETLNLTVSTDGDRTNTNNNNNNNNNNNVDDTAASAFATTSGAGDSQTLNIQQATNKNMPPAALASLPVDMKEASIVIAHVDGVSAIVGRAGTSEPLVVELALTGTWRDEENLRCLFASAELEPRHCVLFLVVVDYRPALEGHYSTLALFEALQLAGFYYDDPASCETFCPPGVPAAVAPWRGAEAISALSDFLEQAVIWRVMYEDYGPEIMKRVGGCRGGCYQQLIPLQQPDGSLRNPGPGWRRVGGY
jgi:hypothetical protein